MMNGIRQISSAFRSIASGINTHSGKHRSISTVTALLMGMVMLVAFSSQAQAQTPSDLDTLKITSVSGVAPGATFDLDVYVIHPDTLVGSTFLI